MIRLAHKLLAQKQVPKVYESSKIHKGAEGSLVIAQHCLSHDCPIIIADNVADYLNQQRRETASKQLFADFPPMLPVFPYFFIEFNVPSLHYPGDHRMPVTSFQMDVVQEGVCLIVESDFVKVRNDKAYRQLYPSETSRAQWGLTGTRFVTRNDGSVIPVGTYDVLLDEQGRNLVSGDRCLIRRSPEGGDPGAAVFLMTMAFLHGNANRIDVTQAEGPSLEWCRSSNVPELKYQMLQINPNVGLN